jgi:hypothetical protein
MQRLGGSGGKSRQMPLERVGDSVEQRSVVRLIQIAAIWVDVVGFTGLLFMTNRFGKDERRPNSCIKSAKSSRFG